MKPAPICVISGSSEVDALRSRTQAPVKSGLSGRLDFVVAKVRGGLKTAKLAAAAIVQSRKCLIRFEARILLGSNSGIESELCEAVGMLVINFGFMSYLAGPRDIPIDFQHRQPGEIRAPL